MCVSVFVHVCGQTAAMALKKVKRTQVCVFVVVVVCVRVYICVCVCSVCVRMCVCDVTFPSLLAQTKSAGTPQFSLLIVAVQVRKGMVLVDEKMKPVASWEFDADIAILTHSTTIQPRYQVSIMI